MELAKALKANSTLAILDLRDSEIGYYGDKGLKAIYQALQNTQCVK